MKRQEGDMIPETGMTEYKAVWTKMFTILSKNRSA